MKTCYFIVVQIQGNWWVDSEGKAFGPLPNRDGAIRHARELAEAITDPQQRPQVWATMPGERPTIIWSGPERSRGQGAAG